MFAGAVVSFDKPVLNEVEGLRARPFTCGSFAALWNTNAYIQQCGPVCPCYDLDFIILLALGGYTQIGVINLRMENAKPDFVARRRTDIIPEKKKS